MMFQRDIRGLELKVLMYQILVSIYASLSDIPLVDDNIKSIGNSRNLKEWVLMICNKEAVGLMAQLSM